MTRAVLGSNDEKLSKNPAVRRKMVHSMKYSDFTKLEARYRLILEGLNLHRQWARSDDLTPDSINALSLPFLDAVEDAWQRS